MEAAMEFSELYAQNATSDEAKVRRICSSSLIRAA